MTTTTSPVNHFRHGRLRVQGGVLPDAFTAYCTYGDPQNPCIVVPTHYSSKLQNHEFLVGEDKALNPKKYFIVTIALFSNGESSSPSNTDAPYNGPYFPAISYEDNIRAQHALLTSGLGVKEVFCVIGFSMGGQQAYYWPVVFPDFVKRFVCICGSARTSPHNSCFLEGPKAALVASKDFEGGHYKSPPEHGIRAFGRVYSAWAYGQAWYRQNQHLYDGTYPDLNAFIRENWELPLISRWDANDLLTLLHTWQQGDVSLVRDNGDLAKCLASIKAKGLVMPCKTDLYFSPEDNEAEVVHNDRLRLVVIDSVWGHMAGTGSNAKDVAFVDKEVKAFLEE